MIQALIFDFDGLIIDTETPWYEAYRQVYEEEHDVELPLELWGKVIGTTFTDFNPYTYLIENAKTEVDLEQIKKLTRARHTELMKGQSLRPGVEQYVHDAKAAGYKLGLATSSTRQWVDRVMTDFDLLRSFDVIVTADDVTRVKPDPELYIKAMGRLQVKASEVIVFEDSLNGLRAAKAAGATCVVVPNQVTSFMDFQKHDLRIDSMSQKTLQQVVTAVT